MFPPNIVFAILVALTGALLLDTVSTAPSLPLPVGPSEAFPDTANVIEEEAGIVETAAKPAPPPRSSEDSFASTYSSSSDTEEEAEGASEIASPVVPGGIVAVEEEEEAGEKVDQGVSGDDVEILESPAAVPVGDVEAGGIQEIQGRETDGVLVQESPKSPSLPLTSEGGKTTSKRKEKKNRQSSRRKTGTHRHQHHSQSDVTAASDVVTTATPTPLPMTGTTEAAVGTTLPEPELIENSEASNSDRLTTTVSPSETTHIENDAKSTDAEATTQVTEVTTAEAKSTSDASPIITPSELLVVNGVEGDEEEGKGSSSSTSSSTSFTDSPSDSSVSLPSTPTTVQPLQEGTLLKSMNALEEPHNELFERRVQNELGAFHPEVLWGKLGTTDSGSTTPLTTPIQPLFTGRTTTEAPETASETTSTSSAKKTALKSNTDNLLKVEPQILNKNKSEAKFSEGDGPSKQHDNSVSTSGSRLVSPVAASLNTTVFQKPHNDDASREEQNGSTTTTTINPITLDHLIESNIRSGDLAESLPIRDPLQETKKEATTTHTPTFDNDEGVHSLLREGPSSKVSLPSTTPVTTLLTTETTTQSSRGIASLSSPVSLFSTTLHDDADNSVTEGKISLKGSTGSSLQTSASFSSSSTLTTSIPPISPVILEDKKNGKEKSKKRMNKKHNRGKEAQKLSDNDNKKVHTELFETMGFEEASSTTSTASTPVPLLSNKERREELEATTATTPLLPTSKSEFPASTSAPELISPTAESETSTSSPSLDASSTASELTTSAPSATSFPSSTVVSIDETITTTSSPFSLGPSGHSTSATTLNPSPLATTTTTALVDEVGGNKKERHNRNRNRHHGHHKAEKMEEEKVRGGEGGGEGIENKLHGKKQLPDEGMPNKDIGVEEHLSEKLHKDRKTEEENKMDVETTNKSDKSNGEAVVVVEPKLPSPSTDSSSSGTTKVEHSKKEKTVDEVETTLKEVVGGGEAVMVEEEHRKKVPSVNRNFVGGGGSGDEVVAVVDSGRGRDGKKEGGIAGLPAPLTTSNTAIDGSGLLSTPGGSLPPTIDTTGTTEGGDTGGVGEVECTDYHESCAVWVKNDFCRSKFYRRETKALYCAASCGLCGVAISVAGPIPVGRAPPAVPLARKEQKKPIFAPLMRLH